MATQPKDFVVKNGLVVQGTGGSNVTLPLSTNGYVTTTAGVLGSVATIPNAGLTNSTITINGTEVSLGGSTSVSAGAISTLTIGTGLSGTSFNGTAPTTIANSGVLSVNGATGVITDIATLSSPTFTGVPLSTTAAVNTNTTQIATTAFVINQEYSKTSTTASEPVAPVDGTIWVDTDANPDQFAGAEDLINKILMGVV